MNLIVGIKQVPDTESKIRIAEDGKSIIEDPINFIMNPFDEFALEEALRIKEAKGGEVTLISAGKERVISALRAGLAMGADKAILIKDDLFEESDSLTVARALASIIKENPYDLIFFGRIGVGTDNGQVGPMVAQILGLPHIGVVVKLEYREGRLRAHREIEGALEVVESPLPAVVTAQKGLNEPRYASLKGIMMAKKKEIIIKTAMDAGLSSDDMGEKGSRIRMEALTLPPERPAGKIIPGEAAHAVQELARLLREEAQVL